MPVVNGKLLFASPITKITSAAKSFSPVRKDGLFTLNTKIIVYSPTAFSFRSMTMKDTVVFVTYKLKVLKTIIVSNVIKMMNMESFRNSTVSFFPNKPMLHNIFMFFNPYHNITPNLFNAAFPNRGIDTYSMFKTMTTRTSGWVIKSLSIFAGDTLYGITTLFTRFAYKFFHSLIIPKVKGEVYA